MPARIARSPFPEGTYYLSGNEAAAEGALAAGCRFYAGYPITPASDIMEFLAAEFGGNADRHARARCSRGFRRQTSTGADHRRNESVESEDRRGRKSRQNDDWLVTDDAETERLARLERNTVHKNARFAQSRYHLV